MEASLIIKQQILISVHTLDYVCFFRYIPTRLWGFSGHVQTIVHSVLGRFKCPWPLGERIHLTLPDNSLLTYDLYQPLGHKYEGKGANLYLKLESCRLLEQNYANLISHYIQICRHCF